jgi:hypothetical protein
MAAAVASQASPVNRKHMKFEVGMFGSANVPKLEVALQRERDQSQVAAALALSNAKRSQPAGGYRAAVGFSFPMGHRLTLRHTHVCGPSA